MTAAADEYVAQGPINVKSVCFETANASANGTFDLRDESDANGGKNIVPLYNYVHASLTPPAQWAVESYVTNLEKIHLVSLPTAGRVFIYLNRR
jgi:hypothetical protein